MVRHQESKAGASAATGEKCTPNDSPNRANTILRTRESAQRTRDQQPAVTWASLYGEGGFPEMSCPGVYIRLSLRGNVTLVHR